MIGIQVPFFLSIKAREAVSCGCLFSLLEKKPKRPPPTLHLPPAQQMQRFTFTTGLTFTHPLPPPPPILCDIAPLLVADVLFVKPYLWDRHGRY